MTLFGKSLGRSLMRGLKSKALGRAVRSVANAGLNRATSAALGAISGSGAYRMKRGRRPRYYKRRSFRGSGAYRMGSGANFTSYKAKGSDVQRLLVTHREYIGDMYSTSCATTLSTSASGPWSQESFLINAGSATLFPWLSGIAVNYTKYRFKKLIFTAKSLLSESTANTGGTVTGVGQYAIACNYNVNEVGFTNGIPMPGTTAAPGNTIGSSTYMAFPSMSEVLNSEGAISTKPTNSMSFGVECNKGDVPYKWYFVSNDYDNLDIDRATQGDQDRKLYCPGMVQFSSSGIPATITASEFVPVCIAQLWAEYVVEFETANIPKSHGVNEAMYAGSGSTASDLFAGTAYRIMDTLHPGEFVDVDTTANKIKLPRGIEDGIYRIQLYFAGDDAAVSAITQTIINGTVLDANFLSGTGEDAGVSYRQFPAANTQTTSMYYELYVDVNNSAVAGRRCEITFAITTHVSGTVKWDVRISKIDNNNNIDFII